MKNCQICGCPYVTDSRYVCSKKCRTIKNNIEANKKWVEKKPLSDNHYANKHKNNTYRNHSWMFKKIEEDEKQDED